MSTNVFLRSSKEYIVALYLDEMRISYVVEPYGLFELYRPDFLLPEHNLIIEVKDTNKRRLKVISQRREYYNKLGYRMIAIGREKHFTKMMKLIPNSNALIDEWKSKKRDIPNNSGINNPRFGTKCTEETKRKISEKAKERCQSDHYRKMISDNILKFYASEKGKEVRDRMSQPRTERENRKCIICGSEFHIKKTIKKRTCSIECRSKWYSKKCKSGEIVLPKQTKEDGMRGPIIRTLKQWVTRANLTMDDLDTEEAFGRFLKIKQDEGLISKRTCLTSLDRFFHMFGGRDEFLSHLEEYRSYVKDKEIK